MLRALNTFGRFKQPRHKQLQYHRPAMRLQLDHIFASEGMRRREIQQQALVDRLAIFIEEFEVFCLSSRHRICVLCSQNRSEQRHELMTRHPNNAHRTAPGGGGNCNDGVLVSGEHR